MPDDDIFTFDLGLGDNNIFQIHEILNLYSIFIRNHREVGSGRREVERVLRVGCRIR